MTEPVPSPRSQQLLVTLFGLYAREEGDCLPVASIVRMLGELGIDQLGVRSSVSRLKRQGVLESRREQAVATYAISPGSLQIFAEGDQRIYQPMRAKIQDPWLLAIFSVPESERASRHVLRTELKRLGFGSVTSGVWIAPVRVLDQVETRVRRLGLRHYVNLFTSDFVGTGALLHEPSGEDRENSRTDLREKVSQWWDLGELENLYAEFVFKHEPMLQRWQGEYQNREQHSGETDSSQELDRSAFVDYIPMFTRWRHFPYLDPGLPLELLPDGWIGRTAEQLFADLLRLLSPLAHNHATRLISPR